MAMREDSSATAMPRRDREIGAERRNPKVRFEELESERGIKSKTDS